MSNPARSIRFDSVQILRLLAAMSVVVTHSLFYVQERLDKGTVFLGQGAGGVDLFFVISGFVMVISSTKLVEDDKGWMKFILHRLVRIVPLYWLITTIKILIMNVAPGVALHSELSFGSIVTSYLFIPHFNIDGRLEPLLGVGWTLNFEMAFYLLFSMALFLRVRIVTFLGIALSLAAAGALFRQPTWPAAAFYLDTIALEFYFGILIAKYRDRLKLTVPVAIGLTVVGLAFLYLPQLALPVGTPRVVGGGLPAAVIFLAFLSLEQKIRNLNLKWLLFLGDASYAIYLIHPIIARAPPAILAHLGFHSTILSIGCSVSIALIGGAILHQFVEVPVTKRLKAVLAEKRRY